MAGKAPALTLALYAIAGVATSVSLVKGFGSDPLNIAPRGAPDLAAGGDRGEAPKVAAKRDVPSDGEVGSESGTGGSESGSDTGETGGAERDAKQAADEKVVAKTAEPKAEAEPKPVPEPAAPTPPPDGDTLQVTLAKSLVYVKSDGGAWGDFKPGVRRAMNRVRQSYAKCLVKDSVDRTTLPGVGTVDLKFDADEDGSADRIQVFGDAFVASPGAHRCMKKSLARANWDAPPDSSVRFRLHLAYE